MSANNKGVWERLLSDTRIGGEKSIDEPGRTPFNSDHDRIVFSGAFRRLAKKTQVHPLASNDHVHNRLTHSLEVACVGRSLGNRAGEHIRAHLPVGMSPRDIGDIVEAACLAHDIGNPPFGHTGENAIGQWLSDTLADNGCLSSEEKDDLCAFEGNAQGFRVVTTTEYRVFAGGMKLTYSTLGAFMKYPWLQGKGPKEDKFGAFLSEKGYFHEVVSSLGMKRISEDCYARHPLAHLMEAADDFCYRLLDVEDAIEMGILDWSDFSETFAPILGNTSDKIGELRPGQRPVAVRGRIISSFIDSAAEAFKNHESQLINGEVNSLLELCSDDVKEALSNAKTIANERIFNHPRKIELEIGSYRVIGTLLSIITDALVNNESGVSKQVIKLIGPSTLNSHSASLDDVTMYERFRRAIDFVSGMTDNYATFLASQFNGWGGTR
ncbi:deoxyguanosinetriphosphate triphosphohydrolase [Xanthomonas sacchari]|uniref:deoxyguanosinetriphosphate triphosphohydrolase n=1 Tax=Xanthomonas TaxID=338 RepID=UPI0012657F0C|nr:MULTISPECIES: deoxyguanosinetriphosphate triphosphohydrolase [Xanthomonas]KAB7778976.1 deoxyguanosinetriphosphate triphosphohydrolase [Xanthomonas sp. LMG 12460]MCW0413769.1 Deoxyguanosinetriphosphate triphosphohydrolase [Xanthomonas sacchari]UYK66784.1 deoxyguanosinetriphosphate triphosphohydrolase [Xanthomonas sacchari]